VFGIARTTGTPGARWRSIEDVGIAAAIESTVCSGTISGPISPSRFSMSCGFTAITTTPARATASAFASVTTMPYCSSSARRCSSRRTLATSSEGALHPDERRPEISAAPILPAPSTAIRRSSTATLGV
jgi:hypothetical protein